jgi:hypothetical protein
MWYDALKFQVDDYIDTMLDTYDEEQQDTQPTNADNAPLTATVARNEQGVKDNNAAHTLASRVLRKRCPACFGRRNWGGDPDM